MRTPRAVLVAVLVVAFAAPGTAVAGRTHHGWLYGTEVMPERGVELQSWILEQNDLGDARAHESLFWWGALVGVTDRLELALPLELTWAKAEAGPSFTFERFGLEARYRFVSQDPQDAPEFAPLARVAVKRDVIVRDIVRVEADVVGSFDRGRLHLLVDAGMVGELGRSRSHFEIRPGAGISVRAVGDLRFGAEVYSELALDSDATSWVAAGPNAAWSHGRFWISGSFGIGLYNVKTAPRFMWGIAF